MTSRSEELAIGGSGCRVDGCEVLPRSIGLFEHAGTEAPGQPPNGTVIFQPITLEPLDRYCLSFDCLNPLWCDRVAENWQTTMPLPVRSDRAGNALVRFRK